MWQLHGFDVDKVSRTEETSETDTSVTESDDISLEHSPEDDETSLGSIHFACSAFEEDAEKCNDVDVNSNSGVVSDIIADGHGGDEDDQNLMHDVDIHALNDHGDDRGTVELEVGVMHRRVMIDDL